MSSPWRLWINADDFGLTPGVSGGICEAMACGVLTSTTAMVCAAGAADNLARFAPAIPGRIGLHLQLTDGTPCAGGDAVPSLLGADGRFPRQRLHVRHVEPAQVEREWEAQLAALRALGVEPTHLDSHHHVHRLPGVFPVFVELARRHRLPARAGGRREMVELRRQGVATADAFSADYYAGALDAAHLLTVARAAAQQAPAGGTIEIMSHPGRVDDALRQRSSYVEGRERELATLCDPRLAPLLRERGFVPAGPPRRTGDGDATAASLPGDAAGVGAA